MKLLTVDDSKTIRKRVRQIISVLDVEILEAENGQEAYKVLEEHNGEIDLILLDWEMPVMNGNEFLKKIKADKRFRSIPVIMLSAVSEKDKIIDAIRAGAKQYITKPFSGEDLQVKIVQALGLDSWDDL
jgi:two-component system, chemotaxis family, chemotaxis protein CheY